MKYNPKYHIWTRDIIGRVEIGHISVSAVHRSSLNTVVTHYYNLLLREALSSYWSLIPLRGKLTALNC